jgi:hypothetical protein
MNPTIFNAFSNGDAENRPGHRSGHSLARSLSPMQALLQETNYGWSLQLSPMRAFDALRVWSKLAADPAATDGHEPVAMLFDVTAGPHTGEHARGCQNAESLGAAADRLGITTIDRYWIDGQEVLIMDELSQRELVGMMSTTNLRSVLIAGPVEQCDARAIVQAVEAGHTPMEVEIRAIASMQVVNDRAVTLETRTREHAMVLIAENFRHYLAALRNRPASEFAAPESRHMERLMDITGALMVRPIETETFSTSIDIGVNTDAQGENIPANQSLIYDIPSNTWHDEG